MNATACDNFRLLSDTLPYPLTPAQMEADVGTM